MARSANCVSHILTIMLCQANQVIIWLFWIVGANVGIAVAFHAMSSYCIFSLQSNLHKLDALQKLDVSQREQELLLQNSFEELCSTRRSSNPPYCTRYTGLIDEVHRGSIDQNHRQWRGHLRWPARPRGT